VGGRKYGVASDAVLVSVKVLDDNGNGSWSTVLAGLDWIMKNRRPHRNIVNLSLGGARNLTVNRAVENMVGSGILVVVAAGNSGTQASNSTPASAHGVLTVGASTRRDFCAWWSNHGSSVDIYAPGVDILSASPGGGATTLSGTSMAAPHAAGVAALFWEHTPDATAWDVFAWIVQNGLKGRLHRRRAGDPDLLLYKGRL